MPKSNYAVLAGPGFYNEPIGFGHVNATSSAGGSDEAIFYDTAGNDTYNSSGSVSSMTTSSIVDQATGFATNYAFFSTGTDTANLHAGTVRANYVYGNSADTANFFDSSGNDIFYGEAALQHHELQRQLIQQPGHWLRPRQRHQFRRRQRSGLSLRLAGQRRHCGRRKHGHVESGHAGQRDHGHRLRRRLCHVAPKAATTPSIWPAPSTFFEALGGWASV